MGPVANADTLAFFLIAALPLVGTVRTRGRAAGLVGLGLFRRADASPALGTQSRPAFVALVAMVLVAVLTGLLALRHAGALLAVVITGVALVIAVLPLPFGQALTDPQRYSDTNIAQRNDLRLAALEMTKASPVVGLGPAAFPLFHQDYREDDDRLPMSATSTPPTAPSSRPRPSSACSGCLALYAVWLVPAAAARRRWLRDRSALVAGVLLALDGLLTASVLESEQYVLPLWFLAAMTLALGRPRPVPDARCSRPRVGTTGSSGQVGVRS